MASESTATRPDWLADLCVDYVERVDEVLIGAIEKYIGHPPTVDDVQKNFERIETQGSDWVEYWWNGTPLIKIGKPRIKVSDRGITMSTQYLGLQNDSHR